MAISPISDIVLEVAKAADPTRSSAAAARLGAAAGASGAYAGSFEEALGGGRSPLPVPSRMPFDPALAVVHMRSNDALRTPAAPYEKFEAFVLQTFIESMLPRNGEALFGAGTAGEIWKSMLAEGLGTQLAQAGGIGIARMLAADGPDRDHGQGRPTSPTRSR